MVNKLYMNKTFIKAEGVELTCDKMLNSQIITKLKQFGVPFCLSSKPRYVKIVSFKKGYVRRETEREREWGFVELGTLTLKENL